MLSLRFPLLFIALLALAFAAQAQSAAGAERDIAVNVRKSAGVVIVDVRMAVNATQQEAWEVLTDYDRMAQFFPNLSSSKVIARSGDKLRLEQKGKVSYGPFSFPFESVREIELKPTTEIRSHAISGSLKKGDASTRLIAQGNTALILYHSESVPAVWVPPAIGPHVIASQTRTQFESLRAEIMKRRQSGKNVQ